MLFIQCRRKWNLVCRHFFYLLLTNCWKIKNYKYIYIIYKFLWYKHTILRQESNEWWEDKNILFVYYHYKHIMWSLIDPSFVIETTMQHEILMFYKVGERSGLIYQGGDQRWWLIMKCAMRDYWLQRLRCIDTFRVCCTHALCCITFFNAIFH